MSDLHLETNGTPPGVNEHGCDLVVLVGNIACDLKTGIEWANKVFDVPVIYVAGNQEYWGSDRLEAIRKGRHAAERTNGKVRFLEKEAIELCGLVFLGATLWTDYALYGEDNAPWVRDHCRRVIDDHKWIVSDGWWSSTWEPEDALRVHRATLSWIRMEAAAWRARGRAVAIVTHHAPHPNSLHRRWLADVCGAAAASNLGDRIEDIQPSLWIHGHPQDASDYWLGGCRVVCNPQGHRVGGNSRFDPVAMVTPFGGPDDTGAITSELRQVG